MHKCLECTNLINRKDRKFCSKKCYGKSRSKNSRLIPKEALIKLYTKDKKRVEDISNELGCSICTIFKYLKKYNIELRGNTINYTDLDLEYGKIIIEVESECGKHARWLCECDCGEQFTTTSQRLGVAVGIRCRKCIGINSRSKEEITQFIWGQTQTRNDKVKEGKLKFSITKKYVYNIFLKQERKCALSGVDICFAETAKDHQHGHTTASLDRINSNKGYVNGNVQWVHKRVNIMKGNLSDLEFIDWCKTISDNNQVKDL